MFDVLQQFVSKCIRFWDKAIQENCSKIAEEERHFSNPTYQVIGKELDLLMQNIKKMF